MVALGSVLVALAAAGGSETVLLDFCIDGCVPCSMMAPVVEQLAAKGYPVRTVNASRQPGSDLARQFGIRAFPTFVMLVDGHVADRVEGARPIGRLEQMLAHARTPQPRAPSAGPPVQLVSLEGSRPTTAGWVPGAGPKSVFPDDLMAATVRLRVADPRGFSVGSGTIIDARGGYAMILTCGHLFRDYRAGAGRIEVDLFGAQPCRNVEGNVRRVDLKNDLALLTIEAPGALSVARVAPAGYAIPKGARVYSCGCNNGDPPTVRRSVVTDLNRYLGMDHKKWPNIEASGLPVEGRSGGGLFSADGFVIGVCNAAISPENEGLYAGLEAIQTELDQYGIPWIYQGALAAADPPSMPKTMPPPSGAIQLTELTEPAQARGGAAVPQRSQGRDNWENAPPAQRGDARHGTAQLSDEERAALEEIQRRKAQGDEVVCVIRSRTNPQARSEIIVVEKASPNFLRRIAGDGGTEVQAASPAPPENGISDGGVPRGAAPQADVVRTTAQWTPRWLQRGSQGE